MRRCLVAALLVLLGWQLSQAQPGPARRPTQVQVARQFLLALLRGDYPQAYVRLAPEVRRSVSSAKFRELARPLYLRGRRRGTDIELYKLGYRLLGNQSRGFVAFSFPADSLLRHPPEWLEVTFRDTASRQVLGFGLQQAGK